MSNPYESARYLAEYLLFHFGKTEEILPWAFGPSEAAGFPTRTALAAIAACPDGGRALDLGCAVGGSSFVLATCFDHVLGIDFSHAFIAAAEALRQGREIAYARADEGDLSTPMTARAPSGLDPACLEFRQGDACVLPADLGTFDCVHAANLLCRLPDPMALVRRLPDLVRPGGALVLATPCSWLEEFTPRENWLGGKPGPDGAQGDTLTRLTRELAPHFTLESRRDEPFLIREHARKFQWSVALLTVWRRLTNAA